LALKRTDYIVIDDRNAEIDDAETAEPSTSGEEVALENEDTELADLKPLSSRELLGLGLKTSSYIMASSDPFETLMKVSQDFPKYSTAITKRNLSMEFVEEHRNNCDIFLPAGYNVMWINGQQVQARQIDAFALLDQLRRERSIVGNLRSLGFSGSEAVQILSHPSIAETKVESGSQRYDFRDTLEGGKVVIWLNDIEKDKRYSDWPKHASAVSQAPPTSLFRDANLGIKLLQRTWPGQLPQVRRDIHNVVIPLDLADVKDVEVLIETLQTVVKRKVPIRFGIVPLTSTPAAIAQAKVVYHLLDTYGLGAVFAYLELVRKIP